MPFVSVDNAEIANNVRQIQIAYQGFTSGLRGLVAESLSGMSSGVKSISSSTRLFKDYLGNQHDSLAVKVRSALVEASTGALATCESFTGASISDNSLIACYAAVDGFSLDLSDKLHRQMGKDVKTAEAFVAKQFIQGRVVVTTDELTRELNFNYTGAGGRLIQSDDYISREINWAARNAYNLVLISGASGVGIDQFVVSGGSHDGEIMTIEQYEKKAGALFHHNSKALLQPR